MDTTVYQTLSRPQLFWGIPKDYAVILMIVTVLVWNLSFNVFIGLGTALVLWLLGAWAAKHDPGFITVYWVKWLVLKKTRGPGRYTGNLYRA